MMFSLKKTFSIAIIAALSLVACSPEDGETGPVGPIGPEGQIGPKGDPGTDGTNGTDGVDGKDGVASITVKNLTVVEADWAGTQIKTDTILVPELVDSLLQSGDVQGYLSFTADVGKWYAVPYREIVFTGPTTVAFVNISVKYAVGEIYLAHFTDQLNDLPVGDFTLRLVMIPKSAVIVGFDSDDYEEVEMIYGLDL
ncbi:MAG: collagen-like protein [Flavobacteriales bacterium]|nr:collagen-like protein [Flavobacteriales bacterium]